MHRLHRINERLNRWAGKTVSKQELMALCEISERTLKDDLRYMREIYGADIVYDRRRQGYWYKQAFDLAASVTLTAKDLSALHTAVATLTQFQHLALFEGLQGTVDKIDKAVRFRTSPVNDLGRYIQFESVPYTKGSEWIELILQAIHRQCVVQFSHRRYDTEITKQHRLYPYAVKEHRNRWYVVGWQLDYEQIRVFGLDRILPGSIQLIDDYCDPPAFDTAVYFKQSLGIVVHDQPADEVILSFTRQQGLHFRAQPFFLFTDEDVLIDDEREFRVKLNIIVNDELVFELCRFGNSVKVIAPSGLVNRLMNHFKGALEQYVER